MGTAKNNVQAALFFNSITGYSDLPQMDYIFMAPTTMKPKFLQLVNREAKISKNGGKGSIRAQFNSLSDPDMIKALYEASSEIVVDRDDVFVDNYRRFDELVVVFVVITVTCVEVGSHAAGDAHIIVLVLVERLFFYLAHRHFVAVVAEER